MTAGAFLSVLLIHLMAAISPGPSFVVSVRTAASEGFRPAAGLAVGFGLGAALWAGAALFGLAVLFQMAPLALSVLKLAGAGFLLWIAFQTWRHASEPLPGLADTQAALPRKTAAAIRLGLMTQLANPKPAIFFGAVFIGLIPAGTPAPVMALVLAMIFIDETLWYLLVARLFSTARARAAYGRFKTWVDRSFGALIAAFGLRIAIT